MNNKQIYIISQSVTTMVEAIGTQAENAQRAIQNESPAYVEKDFQDLIIRNGVSHNQVISYLQDY